MSCMDATRHFFIQMLVWCGILCCPSSGVLGQSDSSASPLFDVVFLQDGSTLRGIVKRFDSRDMLELLLPGGSPTVYIPGHLVKRIDRASGVVSLKTPHRLSQPEKGLYQICSGSIMAAGSAWSDGLVAGPALDYSVGYFFNSTFALGIGSGIHLYTTGSGEVIYPLYVESRGQLSKGGPSLYYVAAAGYGFAFPREIQSIERAEGGVFIHPAIGMNFGGKSYNLHIDFGLRLQSATWERHYPGVQGTVDIQEQTMNYRRFVLRFGLMLQ